MPGKDLCCPSCKGFLQICRNPACFHHLETQHAEDRDERSLKLYHDPTAHLAINRATRKRKPRQ